MTRKHQTRLWSLLEHQRGQGPMSVSLVLRTAAENGIALSPHDLWSFSANDRLCPPGVSDLVVELLAEIEASDVLDPWVGFATLLRPVVEKLRPQRFVGVGADEDVLE